MKRNNGTTAYTHSVDVDQDGIAWTSGFGGIRGYYTTGMHIDPTTGADRYATATDPVPYAGGSVPSLETAAAVRHDQRRAQLLPPHAGGFGQVAEDGHDRRRPHAQQDRSPTSRRRTSPAAPRPAAAAPVASSPPASPAATTARRGPAGPQRRPTATSSRSSTTTRRGTCRARSTARAARRTGSRSSATWSRSASTARARASSTCPTRPTSSRPATSACRPIAASGSTPAQLGQQRVGGLLAQRLHLRRRLHPRHRRPALHGPDQGRRAADGLLERLRRVADPGQGRRRRHRAAPAARSRPRWR